MRLAIQELHQTKTLKGSYLKYVLLFCWYKIMIRTKKRLPRISNMTHTIGASLFQNPILIKNKVGCYTLQLNDSISKSSPYFEQSLQPWLKHDERKETFLDIGANMGTYSFLARNVHGYQAVHAFEANPTVYKLLESNIHACQRTDDIKTHCIALGDTPGTLPFLQDSLHTGASRLLSNQDRTVSEGQTIIDVPVQAFDSIYKEFGISPKTTSFIKIDVEGAEQKVMSGMQDFLSKTKSDTYVMIEIWDTSPDATKTKQLLADLGFNVIAQSKTSGNYLYKR